ncbi:MAG: muconate cycloisomerase [Mesorhizobium sp.]|uniref:mandelate racemase/muconate lactonizing enzyme family protein n=1 Tax=Mesorhizobium sp. TaxID=1871066 RepID=UPI000FE9DFEB|nr:mandelate racemase/muconate lactonizing enzyme family protein [Mesorhizobium sp.]RWB75878.1 MAG: muconate cycloisomerase [Mesorhizobium sp.]
MKITNIKTTPLLCKFKQDYHWADGVTLCSPVVLIEVETDEGIVGIAESGVGPTIEPMLSVLHDAIPHFIGRSVFDGNRLIWEYFQSGFKARGVGSQYRFFSRTMSGIELALWDAIGKGLNQPVCNILGGAVRDKVGYFGFVQGDTAEELAEHAGQLAKEGYPVLYVKVGRDDRLDVDIVAAVRKVAPNVRLRLDANEAWDTLRAVRMMEKLKAFDIEIMEQPVPGIGGSDALLRLRGVGMPLSADQSVYLPEEVFEMCRSHAVDAIVLGLHETCGALRWRKAAAVAEAANIRINIHGIFETGITTCIANQVGATVPNLDDANQIMWQLLEEDLVESPDLRPVNGFLPVLKKPGYGFELDLDAVGRAAEVYCKQKR